MLRKTRYRGLAKVKLQVIMGAIVFNARRLAAIGEPALWAEA
ncbi:MAG: hypothetical protein WC421_11215 [Elusimicrobiales bacterium]